LSTPRQPNPGSFAPKPPRAGSACQGWVATVPLIWLTAADGGARLVEAVLLTVVPRGSLNWNSRTSALLVLFVARSR
jgi:hypothetical protein